MVDAKRVFLVVGSDFSRRRNAVDSLKRKLIPQKYSPFNERVYYSSEIELSKLRALLFNFSFNGERIVIFKEADKLNKDTKEFLYNNIKDVIKNNYLIFEIEREYFFLKGDRKFTDDKFFSFLMKTAYPIKLNSFTGIASIGKLMGMIKRKQLQDALYTLESIFSNAGKNKDYIGMQILGAMTANFSRADSPFKKRKYFNLIWSAERILKRRKIESKTALGFLITKLILNKA